MLLRPGLERGSVHLLSCQGLFERWMAALMDLQSSRIVLGQIRSGSGSPATKRACSDVTRFGEGVINGPARSLSQSPRHEARAVASGLHVGHKSRAEAGVRRSCVGRVAHPDPPRLDELRFGAKGDPGPRVPNPNSPRLSSGTFLPLRCGRTDFVAFDVAGGVRMPRRVRRLASTIGPSLARHARGSASHRSVRRDDQARPQSGP
jgi:hypothetical protein